jgi:hypothetical protein
MDKMSNSRLFESIGRSKGWLPAKGHMCHKKKKKKKKYMLGCPLWAIKKAARQLKMHISRIIYSKFGQLCTIF